jgi:hypothetical protein
MAHEVHKESKLTDLLCENQDIFAWSTQDLQGMPRELAEHSLQVRPNAKPVKQPLQCFVEDRRKVIGDEITRLLVADFIMEVLHMDWLYNLVLVEKKKYDPNVTKVWRMCIDYTNLNKACPKDPFLLPQIDQVIDFTAGCELLSFVYAYSGFHQIPLNPTDQIKTSFITPAWGLLMSHYAVRLKKCRCYLSEMYAEMSA